MAPKQVPKGPARDKTRIADERNPDSDPSDPHRRGSAWSITHMPPEIAKYAIDQAVFDDVKADDIRRHSRDESIDSFERALICLQSNSEGNQKVYAAQSIFSLVRQDENRAFKEIIPAIENELKNGSNLEFHEAASLSLTKAIPHLLRKNPTRAKQLINLAIFFVASEDNEISDAWFQCLDILTDMLSSADLQREIIPQITEGLVKEDSTINSKKVTAKLMRKLVQRIPEDVAEKRLLPIVVNLCEDEDGSVRGAICSAFPEIILKLEDQETMLLLLRNFMEDTDHCVMVALAGTLGRTVTLMDLKDTRAHEFFQTSIPIIKKLVKQAYVNGNTELLTEFTAYAGQMTSIFAASGGLTDDDKLWYLNCYLQLCRYGLPSSHKKGSHDRPTGFADLRASMEFNKRHSWVWALGQAIPVTVEEGWKVRENAAAGFINFLKFAKPLVDFRNGIHPMIVDLIHDPIPAVRAKMAENIYPCVQYLGAESTVLHSEVAYALSDLDLNVTEAIMPNLAEILKSFVDSKLISPDQITEVGDEIGSALLNCEERLSQTHDWRVHALLLEQLSVLPLCVPGDYVYDNFVPALLNRLLHMRQLPCRIAAADAIVSFLRHCRRASQREVIRKTIKDGFAQGRSVHDRMLFLFMSKKIMEIFSKKYYRDHFFETTLSMADDNVANVRLKAVHMMPDLKSALQMSEDPTLLSKLEETLTRIKNSESDRDVQSAIESVIPEMAKIGVVFKAQKKGPKTKEELEDEAKEREEAYIASLEPNDPKEGRKSLKSNKRPSEPPAPSPVPAQLPPPTLAEPSVPKPILKPKGVTIKNPDTKPRKSMKPPPPEAPPKLGRKTIVKPEAPSKSRKSTFGAGPSRKSNFPSTSRKSTFPAKIDAPSTSGRCIENNPEISISTKKPDGKEEDLTIEIYFSFYTDEEENKSEVSKKGHCGKAGEDNIPQKLEIVRMPNKR